MLEQLAEWVAENHIIPEELYLPPEEYVFLGWFREVEGKIERVPWDTFRGIPIKINNEKQKYNFFY